MKKNLLLPACLVCMSLALQAQNKEVPPPPPPAPPMVEKAEIAIIPEAASKIVNPEAPAPPPPPIKLELKKVKTPVSPAMPVQEKEVIEAPAPPSPPAILKKPKAKAA